MKHLASTAMSLLFCLITATSFSQTGKPALFAAYPATISCTESEINNLFSKVQGQSVAVQFGSGFQFTGVVASNIVKYSNLQSVVIRSSLLNNTIFHVSKRTLADNSLVYIGRIINEAYSDGFELKRTPSGVYQLTKIETNRVIPDCGQQ